MKANSLTVVGHDQLAINSVKLAALDSQPEFVEDGLLTDPKFAGLSAAAFQHEADLLGR
jgi:hypothetical protein